LLVIPAQAGIQGMPFHFPFPSRPIILSPLPEEVEESAAYESLLHVLYPMPLLFAP
jgi:hypothetical protein